LGNWTWVFGQTISRRTSPEEKDSPSFFFQDAMPPSVIVGLIAGMLKGVRALRRADRWKPVDDVSSSG